MPTDPVCGMFVPDTSTLKIEKNGRTYYFCSKDCLEKFSSPEEQVARLKRKLGIAWIFSVPILAITYLISVPHRDYVLLALDIPVQFYSGSGFYRGALASIRNRMGNMDILISLGTLTAFFYSALITIDPAIIPSSSVYFDASAFIITLILTGSYVESITKKSAGDAASALLQLMPRTAHLIRGGQEIDVPADSLNPGDEIALRAGEISPADGKITDGVSDVDTSAITGEPVPVTMKLGTYISSGMRNLNGRLVVRVEKSGGDSTISRIYDMLQAASSGRAKIQKVADVFSTYFVPVVLASAMVSAVSWAFILKGTAYDPVIPVLAFVSVVVVACPCAIGLAAPMVMLITSSFASSRGILLKNTGSLDRLARATMVVFDKTGTVTYPVPAITSIRTEQDWEKLLQFAMSLEASSNHPVARSIVEYCKSEGVKPLPASDVTEIPGEGIWGTVSGLRVKLARSSEGIRSAVDVSIDGEYYGSLEFSYSIRAEMNDVIQGLHSMGIKTAMLSGDSEEEVRRVAALLGVDDFRWKCTPAGKAEIIRSYQEDGQYVVFVGDGINDSVAMETSDAGIAVSGSSQIAMDSGDVILTRDDMELVPETIRIARIAMGKIRQNIGWAIGYNTILIPVAGGILVPMAGLGIYSFLPILAALAMGFSSTSVVINSLLMKRTLRSSAISGKFQKTSPLSG